MLKKVFNPITISILFTAYIFILNTFSYHSFNDAFYGLDASLVFLSLLIIISFLGDKIYKIFLVIFLFITSVSIFFKWKYHAYITEDIVLSGLLDDKSLSFEMTSLSLFIWIFLTFVIPLFFVFKMEIKKVSLKSGMIFSGIFLMLTFSLSFAQGFKYFGKGQIRDYKSIYAMSNFSPFDFLYAYKSALKDKKKLERDYAHKDIDMTNFTQKYDDNLLVIVIGESSRGDHFSINGYDKNSTPKLKNIKDIYSFQNAYSCETVTIKAMHYIFSQRECADDNSSVKGVSPIYILKQLGYDVDIYSLQTLDAFYRYLSYDHLITKYEIINQQKVGTKDIALLPYLKTSLDNYKGGKKVIILHTLGSHQAYYDRVDKKDEKFLPLCKKNDVTECSYDSLINSYDNTIYAIDDFLSKVILMLKRKNAMMIYFSDHGESLGEDGVYFHGTPKDIAPVEQFKIPMTFWFSDKFKSKIEYKNFREKFKSTHTINQDYIYHSILGCLGINSKDNMIKDNLNMCYK